MSLPERNFLKLAGIDLGQIDDIPKALYFLAGTEM